MSPYYCFLHSSWNIIEILFSKVASFKNTKFTSMSQWFYHEQNYTLYLPVALMFVYKGDFTHSKFKYLHSVCLKLTIKTK